MTCNGDYSYTQVLYNNSNGMSSMNSSLPTSSSSGSGSFQAVTENNSLSTRIDLHSASTFALEPPTFATLEYCTATTSVYQTFFQNDDIAVALDDNLTLLLSDLVSGRIASATCDSLTDLVPTSLNKLLNQVNNRIDEWLEPTVSSFYDDEGEGETYYGMNEHNSSGSFLSDVLVELLNAAGNLFGDSFTDYGMTDLGINHFLRKTLLDETGAIAVDLSELDGFYLAFFDSHDKLTEASIIIDSITILGLDTLQTFSPFQNNGAYIVNNALIWEKLSIAVNLIVEIMPSSLPNEFLYNPNQVSVVENIQVQIDLFNVNIAVSILMLIDQLRLPFLPLSSILSSETIVPCLLSTVTYLDVASFDVTIGDMSVPVLAGFTSPGMDRLAAQLIEVAFVAYEPTLLHRILPIFQGPVRNRLKTRLLDMVTEFGDADRCSPLTMPSGYGESEILDFRNLFLKPGDATALGATGDEPYGDMARLVYELFQGSLSQVGRDGLPRINSMLIQPFANMQAGDEGMLRFPDTLFDIFSNKDTRGLSFSLGDIRVSNLDTIVNPMQLLNVTDRPSVLRSSINLGTDIGRPLRVTFRVVAGLEEGLHEFDISASIESLSIFADVEALVDANSFLQFPLGNLLNFSCWLATLAAVVIDSNGFVADPTARRSLSLEDFRAAMSSFALKSECISCPSQGTSLLPEILRIFEDVGAVGTLGSRLSSLIELFATSDNVQTLLDSLVASAPSVCSSNREYSGGSVKTEYEFVASPAFAGDAMDTFFYSVVLAAQVAIVLFAETQRLKAIAPSSPLSAQQSFVAPEGIRLLDWTDIGNSTGLGGIADRVFAQVRQFLGGSKTIRSNFKKIFGQFLRDDGVLEMETDIKLERDGISLALDSVRVKGLDSFTLSRSFEPIGAQTLSSSVQFDSLHFEVVFRANVPSLLEPPQAITIRFALQNVSADIALFVAFDLDKVGALELGSLLDTKSVTKCILSAVHTFETTQMKVSVGSFSNPTVEGLKQATESAATLSIDAVFDRFRSEIQGALPSIFQGAGKDVLAYLLGYADELSCKAPVRLPSELAFIDFRDLILSREDAVLLGGRGVSQYGNFTSSAFKLIKDELLAVDLATGRATINTLIADLAGAQSGTPGRLFFSGDIFDQRKQGRAGDLDADIRLRAYDAYINNLDTFGFPLTLLEPVSGEGQMLNNSASVGLSRHLQLGIRFFFSLIGDDLNVENDLDISLDLDSLKLLLTGLATVSEQAFMVFPIRDITNLQCWLATVPAPKLDARGVRVNGGLVSLSVTNFMLSVAKLKLNISSTNEHTGPKLPELTLKGPESVKDLSKQAFDFGTKLIKGNFLQRAADRALNEARMRCPHSPDYEPGGDVGFEYEAFEKAFEKAFVKSNSEDASSFFLALLIVGASLLFAVLAVTLFTNLIVRRRHRKWVVSLSRRQRHFLWKEQHDQHVKEAALNESTESMFKSNSVPLTLRMSMPAIIIVNIGLFLSGRLGISASASIMLSLGGQTFRVGEFFEFSMTSAAVEIWYSGGKELAIIFFIFSCAWPLAKQLATLGLWFAPPTIVSVARRGSILLWLDAVVKWSMVAIFVLILTIVSFSISIQSPDVDFLPPNFCTIDLFMVPKWGLFANLVAEIISQVSSHVILQCHRHIVHAANGENGTPDVVESPMVLIDDAENEGNAPKPAPVRGPIASPADSEDTADQLCNHAFQRPHRDDSDKLVVRRGFVPLLLLLACVLVVLGCFVPSYSTDALGINGVLAETGYGFVPAATKYSVFTTTKLLLDQARLTRGAAGLGSLSFLVILPVLIVPVLQLLALLVQWFAPLTRKRRFRVSRSLEILQTWERAGVFLLAILVSSWLLEPISNVSMKPGFYILLVGLIVLAFVNSFVTKAVSQYVRDASDSPQVPEYEGSMLDDATIRRSILPVPLLFTDTFRWFLHREDAMSHRRALDIPGSSGHDISPVNYGILTTADQAGAWTSDDSPHRDADSIDDIFDEAFYNNSTTDDQAGAWTSGDLPHRDAGGSIDDIFDEGFYDDSTTDGKIIDNRRTGVALDDRAEGDMMSNEEIRSIFEALGYDVSNL